MEIVKVLLEDINLQDSFFNSLRNDYPGFNNWFLRRVSYRDYAYVSYDDNKHLTSFFLWKVETKDDYLSLRLDNPHANKILKISSFKVISTGKGIGSWYLKLAKRIAILNKVDFIYITVYPKYQEFISFLEYHNFKEVGVKGEELVLKKSV